MFTGESKRVKDTLMPGELDRFMILFIILVDSNIYNSDRTPSPHKIC